MAEKISKRKKSPPKLPKIYPRKIFPHQFSRLFPFQTCLLIFLGGFFPRIIPELQCCWQDFLDVHLLQNFSSFSRFVAGFSCHLHTRIVTILKKNKKIRDFFLFCTNFGIFSYAKSVYFGIFSYCSSL